MLYRSLEQLDYLIERSGSSDANILLHADLRWRIILAAVGQ